MFNRIRRIVVSFGLLTSLIVLQSPVGAHQQERLLEKLSWKTEPIKIVKINANREPIELGRRFHANDDWLNGLTITVQNVSQKAIARIELTLAFPPPNGSGPEKPTVVVPMIFGKDPALVSPLEVLELVMPGERVEIELHQSILPRIKEDLSKLGYGPIIRHAQILVRTVTFVDGSEWKADRILYPDPNNPTEKINPAVPKPSQQRSILAGRPDLFTSLVLSVKRAHAPATVSTNKLSAKLWITQLPETLPCDSIWLRRYTNACGPVGAGCSYSGDDFVANPTPEQLWQVNGRKVLTQT